VGIGGTGRVVATWVEHRGVYVSTRASDGTWSAPSTLLPLAENDPFPTVRGVVVDDSGAALVVIDEDADVIWWSWAPPSDAAEMSWSKAAHFGTPFFDPGDGEGAHIERVQGTDGGAIVTVAHTHFALTGKEVTRFDFGTGEWSPAVHTATRDYDFAIDAAASGKGVIVHYMGLKDVGGGTPPDPPPTALFRSELNQATWTAPRALVDLPEATVLSSDSAGNVAAGWTETGTDTVWLAYYDAVNGLRGPDHAGSASLCSSKLQIVRRASGATAAWSNAGVGRLGCDAGSTPGVWASQLDPKTGRWTAGEPLGPIAAFYSSSELGAAAAGDDVLTYWIDRNELEATNATTERIFYTRWSSSSRTWLPPAVLDGPASLGVRFGVDGDGNALFLWDRATGGKKGSWVLYTSRYDGSAASFSAEPVALSQDRGYAGKGAYDLRVAPNGMAAAEWSSERSVWASVWECGK
jgi:hypothetical protein